MNKTFYNLIAVLLIVIPTCCGLAAVGGALAYAVRGPVVAVEPTNPYIITRSSVPAPATPKTLSIPLAATQRPTQATAPAPTQAPAPTITKSPAPATPTNLVDSLGYKTICTRDKTMTDAQWDEHLKQYVGRKVTWTGWVHDVYKGIGDYSLYVTFDPPDTILRTADVKFQVTSVLGPKLNKDQAVTFSGTLVNVDSLIGGCSIIEMKDVSLASVGRFCCQVCSTGKACGDTCIALDKTCNVSPGCACDK